MCPLVTELLGRRISLCSALVDMSQFSRVFVLIYTPPQRCRIVLAVLHLHKELAISFFFHFTHSGGHTVTSHYDLILYFPFDSLN